MSTTSRRAAMAHMSGRGVLASLVLAVLLCLAAVGGRPQPAEDPATIIPAEALVDHDVTPQPTDAQAAAPKASPAPGAVGQEATIENPGPESTSSVETMVGDSDKGKPHNVTRARGKNSSMRRIKLENRRRKEEERARRVQLRQRENKKDNRRNRNRSQQKNATITDDVINDNKLQNKDNTTGSPTKSSTESPSADAQNVESGPNAAAGAIESSKGEAASVGHQNPSKREVRETSVEPGNFTNEAAGIVVGCVAADAPAESGDLSAGFDSPSLSV